MLSAFYNKIMASRLSEIHLKYTGLLLARCVASSHKIRDDYCNLFILGAFVFESNSVLAWRLLLFSDEFICNGNNKIRKQDRRGEATKSKLDTSSTIYILSRLLAAIHHPPSGYWQTPYNTNRSLIIHLQNHLLYSNRIARRGGVIISYTNGSFISSHQLSLIFFLNQTRTAGNNCGIS